MSSTRIGPRGTLTGLKVVTPFKLGRVFEEGLSTADERTGGVQMNTSGSDLDYEACSWVFSMPFISFPATPFDSVTPVF